jgi:hypothetical protein
MSEEGGVATEAGREVRRVLDDLVARGTEVGLQAAAYFSGELVVDAWAGIADEATGRPLAGGTMAFADPEVGFAFALTKNLVRASVPGEPDAANLAVDAARRALGLAP